MLEMLSRVEPCWCRKSLRACVAECGERRLIVLPGCEGLGGELKGRVVVCGFECGEGD